MADDTPIGDSIDPGTAEIHAQNLLRAFKGFEYARDVLRTANEQRHWMETSARERDELKAEIMGLKTEQAQAKAAVTAAKRLQSAAEENARTAQAEAKAAEEQSAARIRAAQDNQGARLRELEDALEGRRRMLESDYAARQAELDTQIGAKQALLSETTAKVEALRTRLLG